MIEKKSAKGNLAAKKATFLLIVFVFVLATVVGGFELFASQLKTDTVPVDDPCFVAVADEEGQPTARPSFKFIAPEDTVPPVHIAEKMPEFPGGMERFYEMLRNELQYPDTARAAGVQGSVVIEFIVEKDGSTSNFKVLKPLSPECDQEAIRALSQMPKWKPAEQLGKSVRCYFTIPIKFTLQ